MSKLYNKYLELKQTNSEIIYLFKSGVFYIALDKDAHTLSNIFNFKLNNLTSNVVKCGFPCTAIEKYFKIFKACNLEVKIIELEKNNLYNSKDYTQNSQIVKLLNSLKNINVNNLSVKDAFYILEELQNEAKKIDLKG